MAPMMIKKKKFLQRNVFSFKDLFFPHQWAHYIKFKINQRMSTCRIDMQQVPPFGQY